MPKYTDVYERMAHARSARQGINRTRGPKNAKQAKLPAYQKHIFRTRPAKGYKLVYKPREHAVKIPKARSPKYKSEFAEYKPKPIGPKIRGTVKKRAPAKKPRKTVKKVVKKVVKKARPAKSDFVEFRPKPVAKVVKKRVVKKRVVKAKDSAPYGYRADGRTPRKRPISMARVLRDRDESIRKAEEFQQWNPKIAEPRAYAPYGYKKDGITPRKRPIYEPKTTAERLELAGPAQVVYV